MTAGSIVLKLAFVLFVAAFVLGLGWARGRRDWERPFRWAYGGMTGLLVVASILLYRAILTHDFRFEYVIGYTSRDLDPVYLWSAFWGGQEGTYLLWALFAAGFGYLLIRGTWQRPAVMAAWTGTVGVLLFFMMNRHGDPFRLAATVPPDGRGLNPLLQDPWMAAHPPIVFLGYAAMTVPAVLAWVAAIRRDESTWAPIALRWALTAFLVLGTGIIMGGIWAYKVLGWGGFWGWDPVENASLIPWIVSAALIHGLLVQQSTKGLRLSNLLLAMAGYILVLYATFLTRSGVLADFSVHSFPKGSIYGWLLGAIIASLVVSAFALARRRARDEAPMESRLAWPLVLSTSIVVLAVSALLVLIGTSWPILSSAFGKPSTPTAPFYNQVNLPLYVILLAALGLGPFLAWVPLPPRLWLRRLIPSLAVALLGTAAAVALGGRGVGSIVLFFFALLALASNVARLIEVGRRRALQIGAPLAHAGFALMFGAPGAGEAGYRAAELRRPSGPPQSAFGHTLTYEGFVEGSEPEDLWAVRVQNRAGRETTTALTMYQMENGQIFKKPAILRQAGGDLYISPISLDVERGGGGARLTLVKGEPLQGDGVTYTFLRYDMSQADGMTGGGGMRVDAIVRVERSGRADTLSLPLQVAGGGMQGMPVPVPGLGGSTLTFERMSVESASIQLLLSRPAEEAKGQPEALLVETSVKPFLWVLWLGTGLLIAGCILAVIRRTVERHAPARVTAPTLDGARASR